MHWLKGSRIAAAAVLTIAVVGPNIHAQGAPASAVTTVTMYAGTDLTPYGGKINTQHPHVVTAMQVLATAVTSVGHTLRAVSTAETPG